jgi:hypothetical protein
MEVLLAKKESQMALRPYNSFLVSTFLIDAGSVSPALRTVVFLRSRVEFGHPLDSKMRAGPISYSGLRRC